MHIHIHIHMHIHMPGSFSCQALKFNVGQLSYRCRRCGTSLKLHINYPGLAAGVMALLSQGFYDHFQILVCRGRLGPRSWQIVLRTLVVIEQARDRSKRHTGWIWQERLATFVTLDGDKVKTNSTLRKPEV